MQYMHKLNYKADAIHFNFWIILILGCVHLKLLKSFHEIHLKSVMPFSWKAVDTSGSCFLKVLQYHVCRYCLYCASFKQYALHGYLGGSSSKCYISVLLNNHLFNISQDLRRTRFHKLFSKMWLPKVGSCCKKYAVQLLP